MKTKKQSLLAVAFLLMGTGISFGQDYSGLIKSYFQVHNSQDFKKYDLSDFVVDNIDKSSSLGGDVVKFQQLFNGLPVNASVGTALVKNGSITYFTEGFVKDYQNASKATPMLSPLQGLQKVASEIGNQSIANFSILNYQEPSEQQNIAKQRLIYYNDNGNLKLAYEFSVEEPKSSNYWLIMVDAMNGKILDKQNLTLFCNFLPNTYQSFGSSEHKLIGPKDQIKQEGKILAPDNASYNVFALPLEAPTFGDRSVINNPWNLVASRDGWHNDGTTSYTITRGNNAFAYDDSANKNSPGTSPDGGASRNFDFPFDIHETPVNNRKSAITNLFYMNNMMHDISYKFGFTETAKNFQNTNYGLGGLGNDYVLAEAQDGGGTNNANFSSPSDGNKPRMQMYIWSKVNRNFFYNQPYVAVPRQPDAYTAAFGPALSVTGVTGDVALSPVLDGCTALPANSLTNKIGLVERGDCTFVIKVKNLQNAGAIGAIVYNAPDSPAPGNMGGTDATITISSVLIDNPEGEYIKSLMSAGNTVNVTLKNDPATSITPDGDFDNGIIAHEYGHGISNRLTGTGNGCLNTAQDVEQMGEGWSDFMAIMLTNQPNATANVPRGMGTYAIGESTTGIGIRPSKYSPDFAINNYTYGKTKSMGTNASPDVHSIGFVWATMLWDLHWKYVEKYGYSSDIAADPSSGSGRVFQMVMNGMKLQPCLPTFVDGRNAILAADQNATGGADKCMIWNVFARRGLGVNASAGSKTIITDQVEDFTVPQECLLATSEAKADKGISIYPNPAKNEFFINSDAKFLGKVKVEIYDMSGKLVNSFDKVTLEGKTSINTANLNNGVYMVKISGMDIEKSAKLLIKK